MAEGTKGREFHKNATRRAVELSQKPADKRWEQKEYQTEKPPSLMEVDIKLYHNLRDSSKRLDTDNQRENLKKISEPSIFYQKSKVLDKAR